MIYRVARRVCRAVLLLVRRWEVRGVENLPPSGGLIVISNHISYWDPVVIGCALDRKVHFMAKAELFNIPGLNRLISWLGAFPVKRGSTDTEAVRRSLQLLKSGEIIGIFPEGTRNNSPRVREIQSGAAMLALKGRVPVLPVVVCGTRGVFGKVGIKIGEPLEYTQPRGEKTDKKRQVQELSNQIREEINRLQDQF